MSGLPGGGLPGGGIPEGGLPGVPEAGGPDLLTPSITTFVLDGIGGGTLNLAVGGGADATHINIYLSSTPGIDIGDAGTYDSVIQTAIDELAVMLADLDPVAPWYARVTETDGSSESAPSGQYRASNPGAGGGTAAAAVIGYFIK